MTHLNFFIFSQLPVLPTSARDDPAPWDPAVTFTDWIAPRVLELTYTAWDLEAFGRDLGWDGSPLRWDPERRFQIRCELDAAFFHLYSLAHDDVDYVMGTFPIVARHDTAAHGTYRSKDTILARFDDLAEAIKTATPYETVLTPPPADPSVAHDPKEKT